MAILAGSAEPPRGNQEGSSEESVKKSEVEGQLNDPKHPLSDPAEQVADRWSKVVARMAKANSYVNDDRRTKDRYQGATYTVTVNDLATDGNAGETGICGVPDARAKGQAA